MLKGGQIGAVIKKNLQTAGFVLVIQKITDHELKMADEQEHLKGKFLRMEINLL